MSKHKLKRNLEIIFLINQGISYRNLASIFKNIGVSRIEAINKTYNKSKEELSYCVRCGSQRDLMLKGKIRNVCKSCVEVINKI